MSDKKTRSVIVDTSFLISLVDDSRPNHKVAESYLKYFLKNNIVMFLSPIVITEFHQVQAITSIVNSGHYRIIPFNYEDSLEAANVAFSLGKTNRNKEDSRAAYSDDMKLIGQAKCRQVDYLITDDTKTLFKYCETLNQAKMLECKPIALKDGFDVSLLNGGQTSLLIGEGVI